MTNSYEVGTPPLGEGVTNNPPIRKTDGSRYTWRELVGDRAFIRKHIYRWRWCGKRRYYKKGSAKYKQENNDADEVIRVLESVGPDLDIRHIDDKTGHGIFVALRPTLYNDTIKDSAGNALVAKWSNPLPKNDTVTQSEASVAGSGVFRGKKYDHLLNGALQFINHACPVCATHHAGEWTKDNVGIKQRAAQLMPGTEITLDYGVEQYDRWCRGPKCQPDKWQYLEGGSVWNGFRVCDEGVFVPTFHYSTTNNN
jgi:hypothetical protein